MIARTLPRRVRHRIRQAARWAARVRGTRVWPLIRPAYRVARRVVDIDRLVGRAGSRTLWRAHDRVHRLWRRLRSLGFTEPALRDLCALAQDASGPFGRRFAAWELALWHADQRDPGGARTALPWLEVAAAGEVDPNRLRQIAIVAAECHAAVGDTDAAARVVDDALRYGPEPNLLLARANLATSPTDQWTWLNRALRRYGLGPVTLDPSRPGGGIDALAGVAAHRRPRRGGGGPRVSVIVPAHQAANTIRTALDSLLSQTWRSLEIIVVDDGSTDDTAGVAEEVAARDPRVKLVRTGSNSGAYVARNHGLRVATGEFVTCHDADDWSHPEKIERQVRHLLRHRRVVGNTSQQVRASTDLRFDRRGQPGRYVFRNLSSFMFRREPVVDAVGYWDSVRFGADEEFVQRVLLAFGAGAVVDLHTGPLCIQRQEPGSLTTDEHFGYPGFLMGARKDYQESYQHHHATAGYRHYEFPERRRPFPVPEPMLPRRQAVAGRRRHLDVIIASDFRLLGGSTHSSVEEITAQRRMGLRTGLVQLSRYAVDPMRSVLPQVRALVDGDRLQMLVHGESVSCDLLVVRYPPVLQDWQRYVPDVRPEQVRVIVNQPPMSDYGPDAVRRYELDRCVENLRAFFGRDAIWHPIGPQVRQALHEHHAAELPAIVLSDQDWVNIIDVAAWQRPARPPAAARTRIGRHSRDHPVKWPATASELLRAYPDADGYEVHILGGGGTPEQILGYWPEHWRAWRFGELDPGQFLATLDVFVYFTHPDWVESFGRVVLEAMASGVPTILPHSFQDLFGDAGIYAKPSEVLATVDQLMRDDARYETQVRTARQFVERRFGYSMHARRLQQVLGRELATGGDPG